ncbi:MAG: autotransporter domain-containing protein [Endomicrobium sp.]|nr:autotransporter domain-containing protein [Endomicrobium sp.]
MAYFKKFFGSLFVFIAFTGLSYAASVVTNENELRNAINASASQEITLPNSFSFFNDLGSFSGKNINIQFSTITPVTISGNSLYKGFEFAASSLSFSGFFSSSTFTSFYNEFSSGAVINMSTSSYVSITSVTFTSNTALSGGVFYSSDTVFDIAASTFSFNKALSNGGAFFIENSTGQLSAIFADSNTASGYGGFLFADNSSFTIIKGTVTNNSADFGGAFSFSSSAFIIDEIYFASNTAQTSGAGIFVVNSGTFSITNSTFTANSATNGGAVFLLSSSSGIFKNVSVSDNKADNGAGFYFDKSWNNTVQDSSFLYNEAAQSGGALYVTESADTYINNVEFINNSAAVSGGAVFSEGSEIYFDSAYAASNNADNGGAFYFQNGKAWIYAGGFRNNTAQTSGGAIYLDSSTASFSNVFFTQNQAELNGGAVYIDKSDTVFENVSFSSNIAQTSGGAVYVKDSGYSLIKNFETRFNNVSFTNNAARNGGAVYVDAGGKVIVNGGTFSNNAAAEKGGAVYVASNGELVLDAISSEINFISNTAGSSANDIYLEDNSELYLNAQNHNILINGGISYASGDSNITISKSGNKDWILGGNNTFDFDLDIRAGGLVLNDFASLTLTDLAIKNGNKFHAGRNSSVNINSTLEIAAGGDLSTEETNSFHADTLNMYGNLSIGVNLPNGTADKITANTVNLSSQSSKLYLGGNLNKGIGNFTILDASVINGDFSSSSGSYGSRINWEITKSGGNIDLYMESLSYNEIAGLNYNQNETANLIDAVYDTVYAADNGLWKNVISPMDAMNVDDTKKAMETLSGSFYADLLKVATVNNQKRNAFGQMRNKDISDENSWVQASGSLVKFKKDEYASDDFEDINFGIQAGWDLKNDEGIIGGLMVGYQNHDIKQADESAVISDIGAGVYGALIDESLELKGIFALGYQSYETERLIKKLNNNNKAEGKFSGYNASLNVQAGYNIGLSNAIGFKPFAELGAAAAMNDKIEEEKADFGLKIASQNYFYSDALAGISINGDHEKVTWYINAAIGYAITGAQNEIETEFIQADGKMKVKGSKQGDTIINAGGGIEITVHEQFYVYAHGGYATADGYDNIYANLGLRYKILN